MIGAVSVSSASCTQGREPCLPGSRAVWPSHNRAPRAQASSPYGTNQESNHHATEEGRITPARGDGGRGWLPDHASPHQPQGDHATITLHGWHRVLMNTEGQSKAMGNVAFLD
jgi:hypothetical protein